MQYLGLKMNNKNNLYSHKQNFIKIKSINNKDLSLYTYKDISKGSYLELKSLLETILKRKVSFEEAKKTGDWLINFYIHLNK